jgi:probable HAF family extracellular repeat protein
MRDLGTLGGTAGIALAVNNRGQVAGQSNLKGDKKSHPFLWNPGDRRLTDLGTLGGDSGIALWMNNAGHVVGQANPAGSSQSLAFLWRNHKMINLGTLKGDNCSQAYWVNSHDEVVGGSAVCPQVGNSDFMNAFLWKNGHMFNLNSLVAHPASGLRIAVPGFINDQGDIGAFGVLPNGHFHAVLLVPRK